MALMVTAGDETMRIEVRDTGEGIPAKELPHIWKRFYRGEQAHNKDTRGSGLGLALVKELTEAMGGTVRAESIAGQGSCFTIHIPIAHSA